MSEQDSEAPAPEEGNDSTADAASADAMTADQSGEIVGLPEQSLDSIRGSGAPEDSDDAIQLQDTQYDTVKKSDDSEQHETKEGQGRDSDD